MQPTDPRWGELLTEVEALATAMIDGLAAVAEQPPNMERLGEAVQRIEDSRDAVREMRDQQREGTA